MLHLEELEMVGPSEFLPVKLPTNHLLEEIYSFLRERVLTGLTLMVETVDP